MPTAGRPRRGQGSIIGAAFILLILLTSYALFLVNTRSQTAYQSILSEMRQLDLESSQEEIEFRKVTTTAADRLQLILRNNGPRTAHVIYIGVFNRTATETQTYCDVDIYIDPSETLTYTSPSIALPEGGEYVIQLVTEAGNAFSTEFRPGSEVSTDTVITITAGGLWARDRYPAGYSVEAGSHLSGTVPGSVQAVDGDYFVVGSALGTYTTSYYPAAYTLLGSTTHVSGSVSDLAADDGAYMVFQSYGANTSTPYHPSGASPLGSTRLVSGGASDLAADDGIYLTLRGYISAASSTSPSRAFIGYRSNTGSGTRYPKYRGFNGSWTAQGELADAGSPVRHVRVAYCTKKDRLNERIVVTLSNDGSLDAYVWNGTAWSHTGFGKVWNTAPSSADRPYDVAYEGTSGRALVVYANTETDGARDLSYRVWNGTAWSGELYIDDLGHASHVRYRWVALETNPVASSNEIGMVAIDGTNNDANAAVWNGSGWTDWQQITGSVSTDTRECAALAYEYTTGNLIAVAGQGSLIAWTRYTSSWSTPATFDINSGATSSMRWLTLKSHRVSGSNRLMLLSHDAANDACAVDWTGSSWGTATRLDNRLETTATRCLDGDWEPTGTRFIAVAGDRNIDPLSYKTWTPSGGWTPSSQNAWSQFPGLTTDQRWVQVRADPRGVGDAKLLIGTVDDGQDLVVTIWNGTAMTDQTEVTASVGTLTYETFEIAFQLFGDPTEYTCEAEATGSSDLGNWTELTWTVDSASTAASTSMTLQLYNHSAGGYPTSGDGYVSYTSGAADTDETRSQTITVNPAHFRDGAGGWRVKITAVKATDTSFRLKLDLVEFKPTTPQQTCSVEFTGTSDTNPWSSLAWAVDSAWSAGNVSVTLQLYNYSAGSFPSSGDGYLAYTSSPTPDTDETRSQNITSSPTNFRDAGGGWRMRITGTKAAATPFQLSLDLASFTPTGSTGHSASTVFTFTGIASDTPQSLKFKLVSDHTASGVSVTVQLWNYATSSYATGGQGYAAYTSTGANETRWLNVTAGAADYVSGGEARLRITSTRSASFSQRVNLLKLDYSYAASGLPFDTYRTYTITVSDGATGDPRPYAGLVIFSNGTTVVFDGLSNPAYVNADENGTYELILKSSTVGGETFKLYVLVGGVAAEKEIVQSP